MNRTTITIISACVYSKVVCAVLRAFKIDYRVCSVSTKVSDIYYPQEEYNFNVNFLEHDSEYYLNLSNHTGIPLKCMKDVKSINLDFTQEEYPGLVGVFSTPKGYIVKTKTDWWVSEYVFTDLTFPTFIRENISQLCYKITKETEGFPGFTEIQKYNIDDIPKVDKNDNETLIKSEFYLSDTPRRFIVNNIRIINPHHLPVHKDPFHTIACTVVGFIGTITSLKNDNETNK